MAEKAKLIITFSRSALEGETVSFYRVDDETTQGVLIKSEFVQTRTKKGQLPIGNITSTPGEAEAIAFVKYFNIDHNPAGLMSIVRGLNVVTIEIDWGWSFDDLNNDVGAVFDSRPSIPPTFKITNVNIVASDNPCQSVKLRVVMSEQADSYSLLNSLIATPVTTNPFFIVVDRMLPMRIIINKAGRTSIDLTQAWWGRPNMFIRKLFLENITFDINNSPFLGATVTMQTSYPNQLIQRPAPPEPFLTYSLNGTDYFSSPTFTGLLNGGYTAYIKDAFGCIMTKFFKISDTSTGREAYVQISDLNSVGFAENKIWNGIQNGIDKNPENVLDSSDRQDVLFDERIIYRDADKIRLQFKSNYDYNYASVESCINTFVYEPFIEKMSNNLNLFEGLDAKMYSYGDGSLTAVYYTSGNIYDINDIQIGTYELNGNVPDSAIIGNLIEINPVGLGIGGLHRISDIIYDENTDKKVLLFEYDCNTVYPVDVITKAYYDILNFEVYEFDVPFNQVDGVPLVPGPVLDTLYRIRIRVSDDLYAERNFYSNWIELIPDNRDYDLNKYFTLNYWSENNRSIFYLYGIKHFIRQEVDFSHSIFEDETDSVKGDSGSYLTEATVNQGIKIIFANVTYKVLIKLILAVTSEHLFVNGLGYIKEGNVESEPVPNTNLYSLTVTLMRNNENFNTFVSGKSGKSEGYKRLYLPKLLKKNIGGFIKV